MAEPFENYELMRVDTGTVLKNIGDKSVILAECQTCGAVVTNRNTHNKWHDTLRKIKHDIWNDLNDLENRA